jgi:hypothetical protein
MELVTERERVVSTREYHPEYMGPKPLRDQVVFLGSEFGLSVDVTLGYIEEMEKKNPRPEGFEGWFAVPKIDVVARRHFAKEFTLTGKDWACLKMVLEKIARDLPVDNQLEHVRDLTLRRSNRSYDAFYVMGQKQHGNFLVFPAQFGKKYRGYSPRGAVNAFSKNEFELDAFSVACMMFAHPMRLRDYDNLGIICPGSEVLDTHPIMVEKGITKWNSLYFYGEKFDGKPEKIGIHGMVPDFCHEYYGTASGLLV